MIFLAEWRRGREGRGYTEIEAIYCREAIMRGCVWAGIKIDACSEPAVIAQSKLLALNGMAQILDVRVELIIVGHVGRFGWIDIEQCARRAA